MSLKPEYGFSFTIPSFVLKIKFNDISEMKLWISASIKLILKLNFPLKLIKKILCLIVLSVWI